jgi:antibiotic biosynthesis monooxygenase (ABM) superfamily enzyme
MESLDAGGVTGLIYRRVSPGSEAEAESLMRELMALSRRFKGFLGSEIFPPIPGLQEAYVVLYRFDSATQLRGWLGCDRRQELLRRMASLLAEPAKEIFFAHGRRQAGTASSVFAYRIRADREAEFMDWRRRIVDAVGEFDGFLGTESFDTLEGDDPEFIVVVRFDSRVHLDAWLGSPVRAGYLREVSDYVHGYRLRRIGSGFEGWFDTSRDDAPPVRWRQALLILSALFPVIMVMRHLLSPVFHMLPMPAAFLVLLGLDITVLTYLVMPRYTRLMNFWTKPGADFTWRQELSGLAVVLGLLAATLAVSLVFE